MTLSRFHNRIEEKAKDYHKPPVLVVAFGDSVTQGFTKLGKLDSSAVYHSRLKLMLEHKYPGTTFSVINAGVGGMTASGGLKTLKRDVISHKPDLVIIGFGLNDCLAGKEGLPLFSNAIETSIMAIQKKTEADILLLTPNFMCTSDNKKVHSSLRHLVKQFIELQQSRTLASYARAIIQIGNQYSIPVADVYAAWQKMARKGVDTNRLLANGLNHPAVEAQLIPAELIMQIIDPGRKISVIDELIKKSKTVQKDYKDSKR